MLFFIIFILILFLLFFYLYHSSYSPSLLSSDSITPIPLLSSDSINNDSDFHPTIHSKCNRSSSCGGNLICDSSSHRCKQQLNGPCSSSIDCHSDLICHNWSCVSPSNIQSSNISVGSHVSVSETKRVHWNDNMNQIYYI